MSLIDDASAVLRQAGYRVADRTSKDEAIFEDAIVMGIVLSYPDARSLLTNWQAKQDSFLAECASKIRRSPAKAWNIYTVHLAAAMGDVTDLAFLSKVEEDFRATRKIAKVAVSRDEVIQALLPLLPLQTYASMAVEDLETRLRKTLVVRPETISALLTAEPEEIAKRLLEES